MIKVLGVIPSRYGSTRLPAKALVRINGTPLVELVWERAREAKCLDELLVATDDERIAQVVRKFGGTPVMTPSSLPSGTDRVWEAAKRTSAEIIVNIQGDEPLVTGKMVDLLVDQMQAHPEVECATLRFPMKSSEGYAQDSVVKVVADQQGWALYFSRSPIPALKASQTHPALWYKHLGLYGYRRKLLEQFVGWPPSDLEKTEGLEQLRFLEHGVRIKLVDSPGDTIGVDTAEDVARVQKILQESGSS